MTNNYIFNLPVEYRTAYSCLASQVCHRIVARAIQNHNNSNVIILAGLVEVTQ